MELGVPFIYETHNSHQARLHWVCLLVWKHFSCLFATAPGTMRAGFFSAFHQSFLPSCRLIAALHRIITRAPFSTPLGHETLYPLPSCLSLFRIPPGKFSGCKHLGRFMSSFPWIDSRARIFRTFVSRLIKYLSLLPGFFDSHSWTVSIEGSHVSTLDTADQSSSQGSLALLPYTPHL